MKEVKKYLDSNLFTIGKSSIIKKKNGHYGVCGSWEYPQNYHLHANSSINKWNELSNEERKNYKAPDHISININNETIIVGNMSVDGEWSKYHYLQTYEHIPRGEADQWGYFARSTEKEIIQYIDSYFKKIKEKK